MSPPGREGGGGVIGARFARSISLQTRADRFPRAFDISDSPAFAEIDVDLIALLTFAQIEGPAVDGCRQGERGKVAAGVSSITGNPLIIHRCQQVHLSLHLLSLFLSRMPDPRPLPQPQLVIRAPNIMWCRRAD